MAPQKDKGYSVGTVVTVILAACAGVWALHFEFSRIEERIASVEKRMQKIELAVRVLSDAQDNKTRELVRDALTVASAKAKSGNSASAKKAISIAADLLAEQAKKREVAPAEFFESTVSDLSGFRSASGQGVAEAAFNAKVKLAEYRSAISVTPSGFVPERVYSGGSYTHLGSVEIQNGRQTLRDSLFVNQTFDISGMSLINTVFENVTVIYDGISESRLDNVTFVNCTFLVKNTLRSDILLNAAAKGETSAVIG